MKNAHKETKRSWFLAIFGACFALPALFMLVMMLGSPFYDAVRMQSWVPVDAKLLSSKLIHTTGDSTTYKATADYIYEVNGRVYEGDRVSVHPGSDNVGSYHQDMASRLRHSDNIVTVFYNPDNPQEAIIDRNLRWGMLGFASIFVVIFGLVGGGIMYLGLRGSTRIISPETADKPWLSNPQWADNKITSNAKLEMIGITIFSLIWNLITWPVLLTNGSEIIDDVPAIILPLLALFPAAGLFLIYLMIKAVRQHRQFGRTPLSLTPFPGSIGGQIGGKIALPNNTSSLASYTVKVSCLRKTYSGSGKNRRINEHLIWEGNTLAKHFAHGISNGLEFCVDVPEGLPESDIDKHDSWHEWRVEVESPDIKLKRTFEIPVYRTSQQSTVKYKAPKQWVDNRNQVNLNNSLPLQEQGNEIRVHYPMFYKPALKLIVAISGGFMLGIVSTFRDEMPAFVFWVMCIAGSLMLIFSLKGLLSSLTVVLKNRMLNVSTGLLGIFTKNQQIPFTDIATIQKKETMRSQSGNQHTVYFSVFASLHTGEKLNLAKHIEGEDVAEMIEDYFREKLGLTRVGVK